MDAKFNITRRDEARFHSRYRRDPVTTCWIWQGRMAGLYGIFDCQGKPIGAHRFSAMLFNLPKPQNCDVILHNCGNANCVNPNHLSWGTRRAATTQMMERGRNKPSPGEDNGNATLTEQEVFEIRQMYQNNPYRGAKVELARQFGVDTMTVCRIISRETWNHI